jgi:Protein of unknown function (DUF3300)
MQRTNRFWRGIRRGFSTTGVLFLSGALVWAQVPPPPPVPAPPTSQPAPTEPTAVPLGPDQLDNLVAPIALYPDPLLGQVLAASTYPLELVEAQQWLEQNPNLKGLELINAAKQQNWDPSVQAMVAFPDVLAMLNRDVRWTTDLGNAYLAQQNDVMDAVQRMRVRAQQNGRLASTPQQTVTTQTQNGQSAVVIEPTNPQVIYVPTYNPVYVWGPPVWGIYPPLWYPAFSFGFGFGPGIFLSSFFPGFGFGFGLGGWALGWGWGIGWLAHSLFLNNIFFSHFGFHGFYSGGLYRGAFPAAGREAWQHDPYHRAGVGYGNARVAARYNTARFAEGRAAAGSRGVGSAYNASRGYAGNARGFNGGAAARSYAPSAQSRYGSGYNGNTARSFSGERYSSPSRSFAGQNYRGQSYGGQSYRGETGQRFGSASRSYSAPRSFGGNSSRSFSGNARSFSSGHSGGGSHFSGGHSGGGHSGGGHHGGHR